LFKKCAILLKKVRFFVTANTHTPIFSPKTSLSKTVDTQKHNFTHKNTSFWSNYSALLRFLALLRAIFRQPPLFLAQK